MSSSNILYPPQGQREKILLREAIVVKRRKELLEARFICIEGQAGQGKTTLANQILAAENRFYFWLKVYEEDRDPVSFFFSLLQVVKKGLPGFDSPFLEGLKRGGDVTPADIADGITRMIAAIERILQQHVTFVFDDLHCLAENRASLNVVDQFLERAPASFRFLLLSRSPVPLKSRKLSFGQHTLYLTADDLALSLAESVALYTLLTGKKASLPSIQQLHTLTEGWIMGLVLALAVPAPACLKDPGSISIMGQGLKNYFFSELFSTFSAHQQKLLAALSCLDEIPSELALILTGDNEAISFLTDLMNRNFFVRLVDDPEKVFGFHQLFREFLQSRGECLSAEKRRAYLAEAARYWNKAGHHGKGMLYLARAELFEDLEKVIPAFGSELVAQSRLVNLSQIIEKIPDNGIAASPWFSFFWATLQKERDVAAAGQGFARALALFTARSDVHGELLTLSQLIYYHVLLSGTLSAGSQYLEKAAELYSEVCESGSSLSTYDRILTALNIGTGFLYFSAEMELARKYLVEAVQLAEQSGCSLLATQGRTSLAYSYMLAGWRSPAVELIERSYVASLINSESQERSLTKFITEVDFLHIFGENENFRHNLQVMKDKIGGDFLDKTIVGALARIWEAGCEIGRGNLQRAREIAEQSLLAGPGGLPPHLESEFQKLLAFLLSFDSAEMDNAVRAADRAMQLRKETGGVWFELFACFMLGTVYVRAGQVEKGMDLLGRAVAISEEKKLISLHCSSSMFRAYCYFLIDDKQQGEDDLLRALTLMRKYSLDYFWGWCPAIMELLLTWAVDRNIESRFCRDLAEKRLSVAILASGEVIPLLHVNILGSFSLDCGQGVVAGAADFTPVQRNLLALLLSSKNLQMNTQILQAKLWPDVSEELAKKSFDTLLSRFRKSLETRIHPNRSKDYLVLKKGILSLENCAVDAREFASLRERGLGHYRKKEFWQAGNCFYRALRLWQGCFSKEIFNDDHAHEYCDMLQDSLAEMAGKWGESLMEVGYQEEALQIIEKAWSINRTHEGLVRQLYQHYLGENNGVRARQLLKKYRTVLRQEDYDKDDIDDLVARVSDFPCN